MRLANTTTLRYYIFLQQLPIGIIQGLLALVLLSTNKFIAALAGTLNAFLSIVLVGHYGAHLYPSGVSEKQTQSLCVIGIGIAVNLLALSALFECNGGQDLSRILTFKEEGTTSNALAISFYITVYITLLLSIAFATYFIVDLSGTQQTGEEPNGSGRPKEASGDLYVPDAAAETSVLREPFHVELHDISRDNLRVTECKNQRRASQNSNASRGFTPNYFDAKHGAPSSGSEETFSERRRRSFTTRGRLVGGIPSDVRPPTPPPPPPMPPLTWLAGTEQRTNVLMNLRKDLEEATRTFSRKHREP